MDCDADGELVEADCAGCGVLECTDCCSRVGYFGAVSQPTFSIEEELVSDFSASSNGVSLTMDFDFSTFPSEEQIGALAFALDGTYAIDPSYLTVCGSFSDPANVQVTLENGDSGCLYWMYVLDDCAYPESLVTCWGDWQSTGLDFSAQVNVRTAAVSSGTETMTVDFIAW